MFKIVNQNAVTVEIVADTREDVQDVPITYGMGSSIIVIEDSSVWMLGGGDTPQ